MNAATAVVIPRWDTDDFFTPLERWRPWHVLHNFTLDVAGHPDAPVTKAIGRCYDINQNGLRQTWRGERVWCNPPYSNIEPWLEKAHVAMYIEACESVTMLLPANKTEQPGWQKWVELYRDGRAAARGYTVKTLFLEKRFKFGFPGDVTGKAGHSPRFGCVLIEWDRT